MIQGNPQYNRLNIVHEPERFAIANESGMQYFSGSHVRIFFEDIHVDQIDSFGFQLAQNIRPVYGYHSYLFNNLQYGTKLTQGYIQVNFTESSYFPTVLAMVEHKLRGTDTKLFNMPKDKKNKPIGNLNVGSTIEEAVASFSAMKGTSWHDLANEYDAQSWGYDTKETSDLDKFGIPGLIPYKENDNVFTYNPAGTILKERGFTISIVCGDPQNDLTTFRGTMERGENLQGTVIQLKGVHIVAGPNQQLDMDGKPLTSLYTFIAKEIH